MDADAAYLEEIVARLRRVLGPDLVGVYVGGSYALGDYGPPRSDLDLAAITRGPTDRGKGVEVVESVRREVLPCPARGLELVLYSLETTRSGTVGPGFDLNLNTGSEMPFRADFEPVDGEGHWFAIDRSVLASHGIALFGPPPSTVFLPAPSEQLLALLAETLRWFLRTGSIGEDVVLNACRALRYSREGVWSSKRAAAEWAREQGLDIMVPDFPKTVIAELERR